MKNLSCVSRAVIVRRGPMLGCERNINGLMELVFIPLQYVLRPLPSAFPPATWKLCHRLLLTEKPSSLLFLPNEESSKTKPSKVAESGQCHLFTGFFLEQGFPYSVTLLQNIFKMPFLICSDILNLECLLVGSSGF